MQMADILNDPAPTIILEGDKIKEYCDMVASFIPWVGNLELLRRAKRIRLVKDEDWRSSGGVLSRITFIDE